VLKQHAHEEQPLNQALNSLSLMLSERQGLLSGAGGSAHPSPTAGEGRVGGRRIGKESQMPKLKTKSGAKKRFKVTASGKVLFAQSGKRHGMLKRTTKQIREHRGTKVLFKTDGDRIKRYWLPNG
jgi:large subunit ribosomal protein L35